MIEIILAVAIVFLLAWCRHLQKYIETLQRAVVGLQAVAINQLAINAKHADVRDMLEMVNESLAKIVEGEKA